MKVSATLSPTAHAAPDGIDPPGPSAISQRGAAPAGGPLERLPRLRRSKSAAASAAAFPTDSERLDALFGSAQPARGKLLETEQGTVHRTPIQKQEIENLGDGRARVKINPTRLFVSTAPALGAADRSDASTLAARFNLRSDQTQRMLSTPTFHAHTERNPAGTSQASLAQRLRLDDLREKKVEYKWKIAKNGSLVIGEVHPGVPLDEPMTTKQARKKKQPFAQGHVTLIGGQPWQEPWQGNRLIPEARICGTLYYDEHGELCIDNDSGRFSEYADRTPGHLARVADIFAQYGLAVTPKWLKKEPVALRHQPGAMQKAAQAQGQSRDDAQDGRFDTSPFAT
ncbi:XopV/AopV family type III secretion system effector [Xanthomonas arboricola]|uniref:XopV/AopV family type III secretion system effector n=1 Tax=Xanthomonas arboricola TaxID=56448 RepID=UPI002018B2F8|nr:XopV/AopV family type III secretion system effector [Xanthomonas arboricola]